jgi:hypothetical protein
MENIPSDGVEEVSPALESDGPGDIEGQMVDVLREINAKEESSPSVSHDDHGEVEQLATEPETDETEVEASSESEESPEEAKAETETEETITKSAFLKRVNGLNAAKRKLEKENLDTIKHLEEYKEAFEILARRTQTAEARLKQYEDIDPREQKILEYERNKEAEEVRAKLEKQHEERLAQVKQEAYIDQRADDIIAHANNLADKYKTITAEEIVYKFRSSQLEMDELAKQMHNERYKSLRQMFAKEKKPPAPKRLKPQGSMASITDTSEDAMMDYLNAKRS